jgi:hypothetical protein
LLTPFSQVMPVTVITICKDIITLTIDSFLSCVCVCEEDFVMFRLPSYVEIILFKPELCAASACVEGM